MILITGASGLLGYNLTSQADKSFRVATHYCHHPVAFSGVEAYRADFSVAGQAYELVEKVAPKCIVHCAALTDVDWCESHREETYRVNVEASLEVAKAAQEIGARLIYISTDSVFSGESKYYSESDTATPLSVYSESKLAGEQAVLNACDQASVLRVNFYGWDALRNHGFVEWIYRELEAGNKLVGFEDVIFSPLCVQDLSEVILALLKTDLCGVYHVASSDACTKYDFICKFAEIFQYKQANIVKSPVASFNFPASRPLNTSLDASKLATDLNRPMPTILEGLESLHKQCISLDS